jgi:hypothetical protein
MPLPLTTMVPSEDFAAVNAAELAEPADEWVVLPDEPEPLLDVVVQPASASVVNAAPASAMNSFFFMRSLSVCPERPAADSNGSAEIFRCSEDGSDPRTVQCGPESVRERPGNGLESLRMFSMRGAPDRL